MTVRNVTCDICLRIDNFTEMVSCPACRKSLCRQCAADGKQQAGCCGRRTCCHGMPRHPNATGEEAAPAAVATRRPNPVQRLIQRLLRRLPGR